ncbi:MAG: acyl carrier protein [Gammaproteobacteria bacterium]|nr:acyl carrier protein [Gammaproteobacteria bacterium]
MSASYDEVLRRLNKQLETVAELNAEFDESTELVDGLGLDSFKVLDLLLEVEDEFDISIPMNVLADVRTVADMAKRIHELGPKAE